jgi:hypothetical protein
MTDNVIPLRRCKCGFPAEPRTLEFDGVDVGTFFSCGICIQETMGTLDRVRPVFHKMLECGISRENANLTMTYMLELPAGESEG